MEKYKTVYLELIKQRRRIRKAPEGMDIASPPYTNWKSGNPFWFLVDYVIAQFNEE